MCVRPCATGSPLGAARKAFELVNSPENHDKLGGIMAINLLIDIPVKENETKMIRFANYLRGVFPSTTADADTLKLASKALGGFWNATLHPWRQGRGGGGMGRRSRSVQAPALSTHLSCRQQDVGPPSQAAASWLARLALLCLLLDQATSPALVAP
jgi:hypothetical protein